ncbi:hypothetical protein Ga0061064_1968 [Pseudidiomarina woesei]|uniref:Uncharacterized protein n=1 Tax=Pseudidiomarina woesei TaxID=1381080 RepID=A0A0K6HAE6_9GAMM|nr:hypothetical protein Ga0061064_1968 [Pseudidiomarina woesei]
MAKLFELINDEQISICVEVWASSVGRNPSTYLTPVSIEKLKSHILSHDSYGLMLQEAYDAPLECEFSHHSTFIDVVFTFFDLRLIH